MPVSKARGWVARPPGVPREHAQPDPATLVPPYRKNVRASETAEGFLGVETHGRALPVLLSSLAHVPARVITHSGYKNGYLGRLLDYSGE